MDITRKRYGSAVHDFGLDFDFECFGPKCLWLQVIGAFNSICSIKIYYIKDNLKYLFDIINNLITYFI